MERNINIRNIDNDDYQTVYNVVREAFWNLYRPGCDEHLIAHRIFSSKDYLPELSFVIELNGEIIGCILYTKLLVLDGGKVYDLISFGPVCILPKFHRQGLGRILIEHSIKTAAEQGYKGIVIGGARKNYECYGFKGSKKFKIFMPDGKYYHCIMALPLFENSMQDVSGELKFAVCMESPTAAEVEEFDRAFEPKVKAVLPCQSEFMAESSRLDEEKTEDFMRFERLKSAEHEVYSAAMQLYKLSFPLHEQREDSNQIKTLNDENYQFNIIYDSDIFVGLVLCWETNEFIYIEHLCILPTMRNKQYGQRALEMLKLKGKTVILEIDPPVDETSIRRKGFYERAGFVANNYEYVHPGFPKAYCAHQLVLMSFPHALPKNEFADFVKYVNYCVMEKR